MLINSPNIKITFDKLLADVSNKANTGVVLMLLKDGSENGEHVIRNVEDIPAGLSAENKKRVKECLVGGSNNEVTGEYIEKVALTPMKVILHVAAKEAVTTEELAKLEDKEFNIFCMPGAQTGDVTAIGNYIDRMNESGMGCMAVVSDETVDNLDLINYKTDVTVDGESITADKYVSRIAGIIAGVPLTQSITYQVLDEVKVATQTKSQMDTAVNKGELIIANIAGKPRIVRGVTSLTSAISDDGNESFKKIKIRQVAHLIGNSIRKGIINDYMGKVPNNYDNKVLLCNDINIGFLDKLQAMGIIEETHNVEIDVRAQKKYLEQIGKDVSLMTDEQIKKANTGSHVFLRVGNHAVDAMEDFDIGIGM